MTTSTAVARAVITELFAAGVRDVVLAPGSRNAPLAFAVHDAARAGRLRLHTRLDERTAGFLALGLSKNGPPAAVICTSGTAVANLHPSMLEALHAGVPMIAVTADRPDRLRGTSANQTTEQPGIFPGVETADIAEVQQVPELRPGRTPFGAPMHLNVRFDNPLLPEDDWLPPEVEPRAETGPRAAWGGPVAVGEPAALAADKRTVVVAGDDAGPPARVLAQDANWPLFAEPSSGSRTGTHALRCYRLLLDEELGRQIERVVVFGHPTLSRPVTRLLGRSDVEVLSATPPGLRLERPFRVDGSAPSYRAGGRDGSGWFEAWTAADRARGTDLDRLLVAEASLTPHQVAGAVAAALPPGGLLVVGASSPIRDLDLMVPQYRVGDRRKVIANRGLAGIDGTVSTAMGAALARESTRSLALLGDVTFLHDAGALALAEREARPDLTLVVVNDDGGAIFSMLEQGDPAFADRYDTLFGTPHGTDLAALCAAYRIPHWRIDGRTAAGPALAELNHALASPAGGIEVLEVAVRRDNRRDLDARIRAL